MLNQSQRRTAASTAADYFGNGYHCAEAVATAALEALGIDPTEAAAHGTAFGGGVGRTFGELCGALSGGLIVIGHLYGRREPSEDWDHPAALGASLRQRFFQQFGTSHCGALRERFGTEKQMSECRKVVNTITDTLLQIIVENQKER